MELHTSNLQQGPAPFPQLKPHHTEEDTSHILLKTFCMRAPAWLRAVYTENLNATSLFPVPIAPEVPA